MTQTDLVADVLAKIRRQLSGKTTVWPDEQEQVVRSALERLKDAPPEASVEFVLTGLRLMREDRNWATYALNPVVGGVLRRKLTFSEDQVIEMIERVSVEHQVFPFNGVLKAAESIPMTPGIAEALRRLRPCITEYLGGSQARDLHACIDNLLNGPAPETSLAVQGAWSQIVFKEISESPQRAAWERIFFHTAELKSSEAPKKWCATAQRLVEELGRELFLDAAARWLTLGASPDRPGVQISAGEAEFQAGFLWFLAGQTDERLPSLLARFAESALKKIPMLGAVSQKVGNACVNVLAELPGLEPVSQLSRLGQRVKYDTAQRLIDKALARAAETAGVSREQLEEMSVSDCGLSAEGTLSERFGDYFVRVSVEDTTSLAFHWSDAQGEALKSVPAYVKEHHAEEWKDFVRSLKCMEKMLAAHRARIERLLLSQRTLSIETLQSCYLMHPLLADMSRRLIWQFESGLGIWHNGRVIGDTEREIDLSAQKTARLWHPISSDVQMVLHWRCWLEDHGVRQPFKQAHREVYLITEAERQTATYSNRFATHVLRQHIFAAICEQRGWTFRLMGQWDSHNTPALELPQFGLRVEYDVDFPQDETEVSGHHIYLLIRTGAVRFMDSDGATRPLESIPPVVFSEVMRDIDLFTGVASIGSDPAWGQQEPTPFREYWKASSFGELAEMAQNRKSVLERLIPQLPIRDRCKLDGHFLVVRGDRTTYRIHLGSGNVLMEPGSRYLCIVEGAATKTSPRNLPLPFEGDRTLSLILSKAFLLADDRKIKDQSILRQFLK
ncbi:MAG TPA: DUF4132 domain-containing protein [Bryobacteraceae bacterium]|nr:DUF4132 domain-containing protein [Bryobacteraceae bacterium]